MQSNTKIMQKNIKREEKKLLKIKAILKSFFCINYLINCASTLVYHYKIALNIIIYHINNTQKVCILKT